MVAVPSSSRRRGHYSPSRRRKESRSLSGNLTETTAAAEGVAPHSASNSEVNNNESNPKLQELKLAFRLLSKQIQGLDGEGEQFLPVSAATAGGQQAVFNFSAPEAQKTNLPGSPETNVLDAKETETNLELSQDSSLAAAPNVVHAEGARILHPRAQEQSEQATDGPRKSKSVCHSKGLRAVESAAEQGDRGLRRLHRELEAERRSRIAAESALQQLQRKAAESTLERERLERVVNSFGGRSLEDLMARLQTTERRFRETEAALVHAQQLAAAKGTESLKALEQAANLAESLEAERRTRTIAEDERKAVTQELRCCLRGRKKAEQGARAAAAEMTKSDAQRESLAQRLEVLRAANKRLEKKALAIPLSASFTACTGPTTGGSESGGGGGGGGGGTSAGNMAARLTTARARLKHLSGAGGSSVRCSPPLSWGNVRRHDGEKEGWKEKAAIERAVSNAVGEKRWRDKLRKAEMQGEAYQAAAVAAETGLKVAVRQSAEMEEVTRILAKKLAHDKYDTKRAMVNTIGRTSIDAGGDIPAPVLAVAGDDGDSKTDAHKSGGVEATGVCLSRKPPAPLVERQGEARVTEQPCPVDRPWDVEQVGDTTGKAAEPEAQPSFSTSKSYSPALPDRQTDERNALMGIGATTQTLEQHVESRSTVVQEIPPPPYGGGSNVPASSTRTNTVHGCESGTRSTSPTPVKGSCHGNPTRPRSVPATEASTLSICRRSIIPPQAQHDRQQAQCGQQRQQQHEPHRHHHGQQQQQQQQQQEQPGVDGKQRCVTFVVPVASTLDVPFSIIMSEPRQVREEVLSTVRNGPYRSDLQASGGQGGSGGVGGSDREGWHGVRQETNQEEAAVATVPIEVLLRLCDRSARSTRCETEGASLDRTADGVEKFDLARGLTVHQSVAEVEGGKDTRSQNSRAEQPSHNATFSAMDSAARTTSSLPPGITQTLAQQVQGAVSRGDERAFLEIIERCGSTERGGIARLLSIDAPE